MLDHVWLRATRWSVASATSAPMWRLMVVEAQRSTGVWPLRACISSLQRGIWKSSIHPDTELRLFQTHILPVLYNAETWTLTIALEMKLNVFQCWCLRRILHHPLSAHISNAEIYSQASQVTVSEWSRSGDSSYSAMSPAMAPSRTTQDLWEPWSEVLS